MVEYAYDVNACDVLDKARLERYRKKRDQWTAWLDDDEHHAVWQVLTQMVWNEVAFRTLSAIADGDSASALNNTLVVEAVMNGHVALQVLAIRRLTDMSKNVLSLSRLIQDVRSNRTLITRENYVCFDGLPYDHAKVEDEHIKGLRGSGMHWLDTTGPKAFNSSQMAHTQFDRLTGIKPAERKREDVLPAALLDRIDGWIEDCGANKIADWSHKYLAHAGPEASRQMIEGFKLTGAKISEAIKGLAPAKEAVSAYLLYSSGRMNALMATPQFDQFDKLRNAALSKENPVEPDLVWGELTGEYDASLAAVGDDLVAGSTTKPGRTDD